MLGLRRTTTDRINLIIFSGATSEHVLILLLLSWLAHPFQSPANLIIQVVVAVVSWSREGDKNYSVCREEREREGEKNKNCWLPSPGGWWRRRRGITRKSVVQKIIIVINRHERAGRKEDRDNNKWTFKPSGWILLWNSLPEFFSRRRPRIPLRLFSRCCTSSSLYLIATKNALRWVLCVFEKKKKKKRTEIKARQRKKKLKPHWREIPSQRTQLWDSRSSTNSIRRMSLKSGLSLVYNAILCSLESPKS